ncbi:MAG: biogenesis protein MshI [Glaciecola sp.]
MRIGLKQYLKNKFRTPTPNTSVGIAFTAEQVLICALRATADNVEWILDASFSHQSWQSQLAKLVRENNLLGSKCYFALSSHWYRIHQIDRPNVPESELKQALQFPLQEIAGSDKPLVYDYADMPLQVTGQQKMFAVAVAKEEIDKLTSVIFDCELDLQAISVEEFATVGLVEDQSEATITLVQEHGEVVVLNIVKNNQLFFSRRLSGFENIGGFTESELQMGISDSICVQIQRSMDFFESQLRQAPIKRILIKLDSPHTAFLCQQISSTMGVKCELFMPPITCTGELNFKLASFSCLGAAYMGLPKTGQAQKANSESVSPNAETTQKSSKARITVSAGGEQ